MKESPHNDNSTLQERLKNPLPDNGISPSVTESSEQKNSIASPSDSATGKLLPFVTPKA